MTADRFFAPARQAARIKEPPAVRCSSDEWLDYCRAVWRRYPRWGYVPDYVEEAARDFLPRVLADIGIGPMIGRREMRDDTQTLLAVTDAVLAADPGRVGEWLAFRIEPGAGDILLFDEASHVWHCPALSRRGDGLIELGAWRWGLSTAKAAWRIARLCGLRSPMPQAASASSVSAASAVS
ncbi:MAG: hypothetical protein FWD12_01510 [Alphaproteobacteria bacterium]|nr:hypothetical protein [Alphaproteobacteria bacterium]